MGKFQIAGANFGLTVDFFQFFPLAFIIPLTGDFTTSPFSWAVWKMLPRLIKTLDWTALLLSESPAMMA